MADVWLVKPCGCKFLRVPGIEWRDTKGAHVAYQVVGVGRSKAGKPTKRRKYLRHYTCAAIKETALQGKTR